MAAAARDAYGMAATDPAFFSPRVLDSGTAPAKKDGESDETGQHDRGPDPLPIV
jgi:hypothetical protein